MQQSTHDFFKVAQAQRRSVLSKQTRVVLQGIEMTEGEIFWLLRLAARIGHPGFTEIRSSCGPDFEIRLMKAVLKYDPGTAIYSGELRVSQSVWEVYGRTDALVVGAMVLGRYSDNLHYKAVRFIDALNKILLTTGGA